MAPRNLQELAGIDFDAALEYFDERSVERGLGYAYEDRIIGLEIVGREIRATCRGSGSNLYEVTVEWFVDEVGGEVSSDCSCPVGVDCKHGVAAFAVAHNLALDATTTTSNGPRPGEAPHGPQTPNDPWTGAGPARPDWRQVLGAPDPPNPQTSSRSPQHLPMGLRFRSVRGAKTRWDPSPEPQLLVRPGRKGPSGKWLKAGVSWSDISSGYSYQLRDADPRHMGALRSVMTSLSNGRGFVYGQAELDMSRADASIWRALRAAVADGLTLQDSENEPTVDLLEGPAHAELRLTATPAGVAAEVRFLLGGTDLAAEVPRTLGIPAHGLWWVDGGRLKLAPLGATLPSVLTRLLLAGPIVIPERDVDEFLDQYPESLAGHATVTSPDGSVSLEAKRFEGLVLTIERTSVAAADLTWSARYRRGGHRTDHRLLPGGDGATRLARWAGQPITAGRDVRAEETAIGEAAEALRDHRLLIGADGTPRPLHVSGLELVDVLTNLVPALEAAGVVVESVDHGNHPELAEAAGLPEIGISVAEGRARRDGTDWFDLNITVTVDGQDVEFTALFTALDRGDEALFLPSGTWLRLDLPELERLRELLAEARGLSEPNRGHDARVNRFQASWWEELSALGVVDAQSAKWLASVAALADLSAPSAVAVPDALRAELRPYQRDGFSWLAFLHANRLGGILADDMGLGKTVQALALCLHVKQTVPDARFLVVAPTSVVENWAREAGRFAPDLKVATITQTHKRRGDTLADAIGDADLVATSYTLFRLEFDEYDAVGWEVLFLDEAQLVKNHQGKGHQCVRRLEAASKIAVTGTPLENTLMDLWSLLSITAPGLYPDPKRFSATYRKPIESGEAPELLATLQRRIAPLMRRRTKDEVLEDLPPKIEQVVEVELGARHAKIYETQLQRQRQKVLGLVGDVDAHRFAILTSLTLLRQLALDPALVGDEHDAVGSAKIDRLVEDLVQVVSEGHRALVFSQFTRFLGRIRKRLDEAGVAYSYLDGRTRNREAAIGRFKDGDAPVFLISLKAGGFGLNLPEADYCFVMDPWWNPAVEAQAVDRAHRIGQQRTVIVYRYVSTGTIEEKVMALKARKAELFANVVDADGALSGALTESDIRGLLDL